MESTNINYMSQNQAFEAICLKLENIIKTDMMWDNEISLSGAAGTGKTYLTTKLVKKLISSYHITITAPTHKALQVLRQNLLSEEIENVETKTLQSFLNIKLITDFDKGIQKFEPIKSKEKDNSKTDILIVDESSMISQDLYDYIINAIEKQRVKAVLFVGDEFQLLPIDGNDNKVLNIRNKYKLEKIVRQAQDSYIINVATKARDIIKSKKYITLREFFDDESFKHKIKFINTEKEFHDDFCTPDTWAKKDKVIASFTNKSVEYHNKIIRERFWNAQNIFEIPTLLSGDKVIFQEANVIDDKIVHQNSDIVEISSASKTFLESLNINFWDCKDLSNRPFKVIDPSSKGRFEMILSKLAQSAKFEKDYEQRSKKWAFFFDTKETFVDIKYIYASTIHKLQGSTYETVYIDLRDIEKMSDKDMMYRLLYVAITRASKDVKILLPNDENILLAEHQNNIINSLEKQFSMLGLDI
jgi:ATP-dependent exoDNAse (exonuclease V) alpha subunit